MRYIFFLLTLMQVTFAEECLNRAYEFATSNHTHATSQNDLENKRNGDINDFTGVDPICGCTKEIWSYFKRQAKTITKRVNPAMDTFTKALHNQMQASDLKIQELVHLKYVNSLYAFYDKDKAEMEQKEPLDMKPNDGCNAIPFREPGNERENLQREGILMEIERMLHKWRNIVDMHVEKNIIEMVK